MKDKRRSRWACVFLLFAWLDCLAGPVTPADAHSRQAVPAGPTTGISIPNITHGQMRVIADYQSAIMQLAAEQFPTDPVMRRLQGFINLQRFTCAWGIVPGSLLDEDSPFNECSHAYLAAIRALLLHLQSMRGDRSQVSRLVTKVEVEMLQNGASLVLCRYSDEPFNTANVIGPSVGIIPLDPINVARLTIAIVLLGWVTLVAMRSRKRFGIGVSLPTSPPAA